MRVRLRGLLLAVWAGSLWTVGFVVAPTLFASLGDPSLAGRLAARFFAIETWLSLVAAPLWWWLSAPDARGGRILAVSIAGILAVMHFVVAPRMMEVSWGHSLAAGLYVLACGLAAALVFNDSRRAE